MVCASSRSRSRDSLDLAPTARESARTARRARRESARRARRSPPARGRGSRAIRSSITSQSWISPSTSCSSRARRWASRADLAEAEADELEQVAQPLGGDPHVVHRGHRAARRAPPGRTRTARPRARRRSAAPRPRAASPGSSPSIALRLHRDEPRRAAGAGGCASRGASALREVPVGLPLLGAQLLGEQLDGAPLGAGVCSACSRSSRSSWTSRSRRSPSAAASALTSRSARAPRRACEARAEDLERGAQAARRDAHARARASMSADVEHALAAARRRASLRCGDDRRRGLAVAAARRRGVIARARPRCSSSRMTPSRRPPRPISQRPPEAVGDLLEHEHARPAAAARARARARTPARPPRSAVVARIRRPRSSVSWSSTPPTSRRSEVELPPTPTASSGVGRREALEGPRDVGAHALQLGDRRRVAVQVGVGEEAGADAERARRADAAGDRADRDLRRGAADVDDGDVAVGRVVERAGRADEREPRLLLVAEHLDVDAGALRDRAREAPPGWRPRGSPPSRRRGSSRCRARARDGPASRRRRRPRGSSSAGSGRRAEALADPGEGALAQQLAQAAVGRLGDQQPRRVRADVDAAADHDAQAIGSHAWQGPSGCCATATPSRRACARTSSGA